MDVAELDLIGVNIILHIPEKGRPDEHAFRSLFDAWNTGSASFVIFSYQHGRLENPQPQR